MLTPPAVEDPPHTWIYRQPGARCTTVYEKPVTIRALAADLGVTMSFLHRKVRSGHLPGFPIGDQTCVSPVVAEKVKAWHKDHRGERWPTFTEAHDEGDAK